ncbi:rCG53370, partial [Rattus norvegicus]
MLQIGCKMGSHHGSVAVDLAHSILSRSAACNLKMKGIISVYRVPSFLP